MSGLFGTRERFPKNNPVYDALGTLDELNSLLGVCRAYAADITGELSLHKEIQSVQEALFIIQAELAGTDRHIENTRVEALEDTIDGIEACIGNPHAFIIPGATAVSASLDYARAVARRAERTAMAKDVKRRLSNDSLAYLNRLSSFLYALARYAAAKEGAREVSPAYL